MNTTLVNQLTHILEKYPEISLAILFGSRATGTATSESDIDLGLLASAPLSADTRLQLLEEIALECGQPVDIIDLYEAPEPILGQVC